MTSRQRGGEDMANMKRPFFKMKDVQANEELIVKENYGILCFEDFWLMNEGVDVLEVRINYSDEVLIIGIDEVFKMQPNVYSCVVLNEGTVKYGGLY